MSAALKWNLVSVQDYWAGELKSPIKHEYIGGLVYAMAGARNAHNMISVNIVGSLLGPLRGKHCRPYNSDTKVRAQLPFQVRFYYPDLPVVCRPISQQDSFQDGPAVLFEVLSKSTRRIDEGERKDVYLNDSALEGLRPGRARDRGGDRPSPHGDRLRARSFRGNERRAPLERDRNGIAVGGD
jgi:Uma2 family endonuclease